MLQWAEYLGMGPEEDHCPLISDQSTSTDGLGRLPLLRSSARRMGQKDEARFSLTVRDVLCPLAGEFTHAGVLRAKHGQCMWQEVHRTEIHNHLSKGAKHSCLPADVWEQQAFDAPGKLET